MSLLLLFKIIKGLFKILSFIFRAHMSVMERISGKFLSPPYQTAAYGRHDDIGTMSFFAPLLYIFFIPVKIALVVVLTIILYNAGMSEWPAFEWFFNLYA